MAADELGSDLAQRVADGEAALVGLELRQEDALESRSPISPRSVALVLAVDGVEYPRRSPRGRTAAGSESSARDPMDSRQDRAGAASRSTRRWRLAGPCRARAGRALVRITLAGCLLVRSAAATDVLGHVGDYASIRRWTIRTYPTSRLPVSCSRSRRRPRCISAISRTPRPAGRGRPISMPQRASSRYLAMLQQKTKGNLIKEEERLVDDLLATSSACATSRRSRTTSGSSSPDDHFSRNRNVERRADDRLRLQHLPVDRRARPPDASVDLRAARRRYVRAGGCGPRSAPASIDQPYQARGRRLFSPTGTLTTYWASTMSGASTSCRSGRCRVTGTRGRSLTFVRPSRTPSTRRPRRAGGCPQLVTFTVQGPFCVGQQEVVPVPLLHGARPILGVRFGAFAYLTDCNRIPDRFLGAARRAGRAGD